MIDAQRIALLTARKRAEASVARLKEAEAKEAAAAEAEGREPNPVQPLTEAHADHILAALALISGNVPKETAEVVGVYRQSMVRSAGKKVVVRSDQLIAVLDAAGIGAAEGKRNADV